MSVLSVAAAFNLVCSGTMTNYAYAPPLEKPYVTTYRIDLDLGLWCDGECKAQHPLAGANDAQITFIEETEYSDILGLTERKMFVSRTTGELSGFSSSSKAGKSPIRLIWKARCKRSEFTGFPQPISRF